MTYLELLEDSVLSIMLNPSPCHLCLASKSVDSSLSWHAWLASVVRKVKEHYALNRSVYVNNITVYRGIKWCAPSVSTGGPSAHAFHCNFHMVGMWRNWIGKQMAWFSCAQGITACPVLADSWFGMPSIC